MDGWMMDTLMDDGQTYDQMADGRIDDRCIYGWMMDRWMGDE